MSERAKFSPGPWSTGTMLKHMVYDRDGRVVADCGREDTPYDGNAALVAAAPALLASCKELRDALAGAMRVIMDSTDKDLARLFAREMKLSGIPDGVGVRADQAIKATEGGE
jgi:hypothetical protein